MHRRRGHGSWTQLYISTISALAGSVIGGLTTGFTTARNLSEARRACASAHDLACREDLVRDFNPSRCQDRR